MSHIINKLTFGNNDVTKYGENSLSGFNSEKEIEEQFLGISYTYFLDIIEHTLIDEVSSNNTGKDTYLYTARLNEVILDRLPLVYFKYKYMIRQI